MAVDIIAGKVPQRKKFLRMYENKYSKKVLAQAQTTPRYKTGDYVVARASLDSYKHIEFEGDMLWSTQNNITQNFKKRGGFIVEIHQEIHSAAKGAKRYRILPIGAAHSITIEERYLKFGKGA